MKISTNAFLFVSVFAGLIACSKDQSAPKDDSTKTGTAENRSAAVPAKAAAAQAKEVSLPAVGLRGELVGETENPILGESKPMMVMAAFFAASVDEAKPTNPKTVKEAEKEAKATFNATNLKSETLSDGWALTSENTGSAGKNYFVSVRRDIGGKAYVCETAQSTPEQQAKALAFCKSLRK